MTVVLPMPFTLDLPGSSTDQFISCFAELNAAAGSLSSTTPPSPSAVPTQNLLMSSAGVGGEASVTLTLADTQGLLSGALDTVTLNIASQVGIRHPVTVLLGPLHRAVLKLMSFGVEVVFIFC